MALPHTKTSRGRAQSVSLFDPFLCRVLPSALARWSPDAPILDSSLQVFRARFQKLVVFLGLEEGTFSLTAFAGEVPPFTGRLARTSKQRCSWVGGRIRKRATSTWMRLAHCWRSNNLQFLPSLASLTSCNSARPFCRKGSAKRGRQPLRGLSVGSALKVGGAPRCSFTRCRPPAGEIWHFLSRGTGGLSKAPRRFTCAVVEPRRADHDRRLGQKELLA